MTLTKELFLFAGTLRHRCPPHPTLARRGVRSAWRGSKRIFSKIEISRDLSDSNQSSHEKITILERLAGFQKRRWQGDRLAVVGLGRWSAVAVLLVVLDLERFAPVDVQERVCGYWAPETMVRLKYSTHFSPCKQTHGLCLVPTPPCMRGPWHANCRAV
jgi:hypothetical protein